MHFMMNLMTLIVNFGFYILFYKTWSNINMFNFQKFNMHY